MAFSTLRIALQGQRAVFSGSSRSTLTATSGQRFISSFLRGSSVSARRYLQKPPLSASVFAANLALMPTTRSAASGLTPQLGRRLAHFLRPAATGSTSARASALGKVVSQRTGASAGAVVKRRMGNSAPEKSGLLAWYNGLLESSPLLTKAVTSALIVLGGDLGCQLFLEGGPLDYMRLARMFVIGGVLVAPVLHVWYGALYRWFPSPSVTGVLTRVALDQFVFAPAFCVAFFAAIFGMEGRFDQLEAHLRENYVEAVTVNWIIWIPAQMVNFKFIPPQLQVLFANFVALFWNSYLSWSGHKDQHLEDDGVDATQLAE